MAKDPSERPVKPDSSEIQKGYDAERSGFDKLHHPDNRGSIKEGYQPIRDITSPPPDGGSGVPDKSEDS